MSPQTSLLVGLQYIINFVEVVCPQLKAFSTRSPLMTPETYDAPTILYIVVSSLGPKIKGSFAPKNTATTSPFRIPGGPIPIKPLHVVKNERPERVVARICL